MAKLPKVKNVLTPADAAGAYLPFQKQTVVVFGDSITARGGPITVTTATYYESDGYWPWAAQELRHALALLNNAGVSGNTTTQMLARIQTDVIAYAPGWCVVMGGVNDLVSASDAVASATATIANLDAIYTRLTAAGIRVVAATINPCDSATTAGKQAIVIVNQWIKRQSRSRANLLCVDFHVTVADPSTGNYAANLTTDGTHPSTAGAYKMGHALAQVIAPHVGPGDTLTASALDSRQILANPMLSGTGGTNSAGSTGTPPTSWTSSPGGGTVVVSKVARTDGSPNDWTQLVITNAGTSQGANLFQTVSGQTLWTPGDGFLYVFEAEYEIDSGYTDPSTNAQRAGLYLTLDFQNGSSSTVAKAQDTLSVQDKGAKGGPYTYGYPASPRITKGVLRTPPITPPATATKFVAWLQANFDSATVRWGRVGVRRLLTASDI